MTTDRVLHELADKWLPFPPEAFFTAQRAPDMWFADELPPTLQDEMRSPLVTQSKLMFQYQVMQSLAVADRRAVAQRELARRSHAVARVGKRVKARRN